MAGMKFDQRYFDALYEANPDPWGFRSSGYERAKYEATLVAIPKQRYTHALELGCSIGELTKTLATRAEQLTAVDTSPVALEAARIACLPLPNVRFIQAQLPGGRWEGAYDLVVLSEILYYLDVQGIEVLAERLGRHAPRADVVLVHWTGDTNYPLSGDQAVATFAEHFSSIGITAGRMPGYRLDVLSGIH
jgi:trans-aconitate methyltransferase